MVQHIPISAFQLEPQPKQLIVKKRTASNAGKAVKCHVEWLENLFTVEVGKQSVNSALILKK